MSGRLLVLSGQIGSHQDEGSSGFQVRRRRDLNGFELPRSWPTLKSREA
jgi:hypothetical protein